ncbi:MAG TPA: Lrp/AsnC ligand binding domain-containing protein [Elusimicrobiota bacterium]|nr:Lrp/AsnC ligand binding domain-containing protein [Elusimicrobiota bacterium]
MVTGLVLVRLTAGQEKQALVKLKETKGVAHISAVYGRWDLVVDLEAADMPSMTRIVIEKIRSIPGVSATETLITTAI